MHAADDDDAEIAAAAYAEGLRDAAESLEPKSPPGAHHWELIAAAAVLAGGIVIAGIERARPESDANPFPTIAVLLPGGTPGPVATVTETAPPQGAETAGPATVDPGLVDQADPPAVTPVEPPPAPVEQQQTQTSTRQVPNGNGYGPNVMPPTSHGKG